MMGVECVGHLDVLRGTLVADFIFLDPLGGVVFRHVIIFVEGALTR
jgi:hypothetical protein